MQLWQVVCLVLGLSILVKFYMEYHKAATARDSYRILLQNQYEHYMEMFNQIYETVKEEDSNGRLVCKFKIREDIKHLFTGLRPEIPICNISLDELLK